MAKRSERAAIDCPPTCDDCEWGDSPATCERVHDDPRTRTREQNRKDSARRSLGKAGQAVAAGDWPGAALHLHHAREIVREFFTPDEPQAMSRMEYYASIAPAMADDTSEAILDLMLPARAETRARMAREVNWTCPHCGAENLDDRALTAIPYCDGCGVNVHWDEIIEAETEAAQAQEKIHGFPVIEGQVLLHAILGPADLEGGQ